MKQIILTTASSLFLFACAAPEPERAAYVGDPALLAASGFTANDVATIVKSGSTFQVYFYAKGFNGSALMSSPPALCATIGQSVSGVAMDPNEQSAEFPGTKRMVITCGR